MRADLEDILEINKRLVDIHVEAENKHLLTETINTLHPECVFEDIPLGQIYKGREGAAEYYQTWWNAFEIIVEPNRGIQWTIDGNMVAESRYVGTHTGDFFGLKSTGRPIDLPFVVIIGFREGLMLGERFYYNLPYLLGQLGASSLPDVDQ
jgi:hypothetical protein